MPTRFQHRVQLLLCDGCCCGRTEQGNPSVPLKFLQREWTRRKLGKYLHLTPCYCLGPCDAANVACVLSAGTATWFAHLETQSDYETLFDWAAQHTQDTAPPLPALLKDKQLERFFVAERLNIRDRLR
jgi:hypothetical protein